MTCDLANYLATARQFLTPEKVEAFEAAYRRMQARAAVWNSPVTNYIPPAAKDASPAQNDSAPSREPF